MMTETETPKQSLHPLLIPVLLTLLFAAASFAAILMMDRHKTPTLPNDTDWMKSYLIRNQSNELSEQQKDIIQNSVAITSAVAKDAGITVTLQSVCGNGYTTYYKVDVELPPDLNAKQGCSFEKFELKINDTSAGLYGNGHSLDNLQDDNPTDHHHSCLLTTELGSYSRNYAFDNGIIRTLHLENIRIESENGMPSKLIKGQWDFGILFRDEGKIVHLIREPLIAKGYNDWNQMYYEAEITSMALSEFSLYCSYEMRSNSEQRRLGGINPVVIMKDGRIVRMSSSGGSNHFYRWKFEVPISLDEVAFLKLSDERIPPMY